MSTLLVSKGVTDDFCAAFRVRNDFVGFTAELVATGELPVGVDFDDPRVRHIIMMCRSNIPACRTCKGDGVFGVGQSGDLCMDCEGLGAAHPADIENKE